MFLEDAGIPEGRGVVDAAGMTHSIVHDDKRIGKSDELVKAQLVIAWIKIRRTWQSNE
jgi:hypothetical protein